MATAAPPRRVAAGGIWRRPDGLRWVEGRAAAVEPSGWRLMIPLVGLDEAPDASPLVGTVADQRVRVHLLCGAPHDQLGDPAGELDPDHVGLLQAAVRRLVSG